MINRFSSLRQRLDQAFLVDRLKGAKTYKRIAGYFRSSIFELIGEEIEGIDEVKIVCNSELDAQDIVVSQAVRDKSLKERWNDVDPDVEALLRRDQYRKLYDLLSSGKVEIKVVPKNDVFLHGKAGVITMPDGSRTSFLGSINESKSAFAKNYEILWEDTSPEGCDWISEEFDLLWDRGFPLPDAILTEIKRLANRVEVTFDEVAKKPEDMPAAAMAECPIYRGGEQLNPWQQSFVSTCLEHRKIYKKVRLLIADEVGLGKTLSMAAAALVLNLLGDGPVLILCPSTLCLQWQSELMDRLGVPSGVWDSSAKCWIDPFGRIIHSRGPEDVTRCPYQFAIVSTGLVVHDSPEAQNLLNGKRIGTVILDEAHKANGNGELGPDEERSNLLDFGFRIGERAEHVIFGTATPIQTHTYQLWNLMRALNVSAHFVLGNPLSSLWQSWRSVEGYVNGEKVVENEDEAWQLLKNPLQRAAIPMMDESHSLMIRNFRNDLNLMDTQYSTSQPVTSLSYFSRGMGGIEDTLNSDFFQRNNPFVFHVVLRKRDTLEKMGLLEKIAVNIHPPANSTLQRGAYAGVAFDGQGLITNFAFEQAYTAAEAFAAELGKRTKAAGLIKSTFLQRICSSFASGHATASRMLSKQSDPDGNLFSGKEEGLLQTLTPAEMGYLEQIRDELSQTLNSDPKFKAVRAFLFDVQTQGKTWIEHGCIAFSQYFDTAKWAADALAEEVPDITMAIYAGEGRSGLYRGGHFSVVPRNTIKKMIKEGEIKLVLATDAACEGLNMQRLGTEINIDLPWNPARLEQRLGRIKRFGQSRSEVDLLNLVYKDTRDEAVYLKLSERMKNKFDIFGGLPDCLETEWIEDFAAYEARAQTHLHLRKSIVNVFDEKWGATVFGGGEPWEECSRVLSRRDVETALSKGW